MTFTAFEGCHDARGGTAGGQIGFRWQSGTWVLGVEGQGNWADFSGGNVNLAFPLRTINSKIDAFGLMTAQIGYAANNALSYLKGGAAVVAARYRVNTNPGNVLIASSNDDTRWGGVVGVGLEYGWCEASLPPPFRACTDGEECFPHKSAPQNLHKNLPPP